MKLKGRHSRRSSRRALGALIGVLALLVVAPAAAQAITVSGTAAPTNPAAGAHSDVNIHVAFGGGQVHDLTIALPPGLVGDPNAAPLCTVAELTAAACPANTQVGAVTANALLIAVPVTVPGELYNLVPQPGEPARFGIILHPPLLAPIVLQSAVQLRDTDFGLNTVINNIPNTSVLPGDTTITSQDITLFGTAPGTWKPFMRNPTSCGPAVTNFTAIPYSGNTGTAQASFTPTNCGALDFSPTFSAALDVPQRLTTGERPTLTTSIDQEANEAGLQNAKVFIPPDMGADLSRLSPDLVCPQPDFAAGTCPRVSVLGDAVAASPLLSTPLSGPVYLVDNPGGTARVGLDLQGQLHLKLQGQLGLDNTTEFSGLPDIPIAHFQLRFNGGPGSILQTNRDICDPPAPVFKADFVGHNGAATSVSSAATVDCHGAAKPATAVKCKKAKKHKKKRAAEAKKKGKKKSCKKKRKKRGKKR
jgi:hypothetical protein